MDRIAKGFTDDEIRAIAAWYAAQKAMMHAAHEPTQFPQRRGRAALLPLPALAQGAAPKVVVIGGGFARRLGGALPQAAESEDST